MRFCAIIAAKGLSTGDPAGVRASAKKCPRGAGSVLPDISNCFKKVLITGWRKLRVRHAAVGTARWPGLVTCLARFADDKRFQNATAAELFVPIHAI
jgi:hypothetical protein